jgi:hypothetical protein
MQVAGILHVEEIYHDAIARSARVIYSYWLHLSQQQEITAVLLHVKIYST